MPGDIGPDADVAAIRELRRIVENSVNESDADAFAAVLAADVAQLPSGDIVRDRDEIVARQARSFEAYDLEERFTIDRVVVVGDLAVEYGTYELTVTKKSTGESRSGAGMPYLYAYERDGSDQPWQVIRMSWGSPSQG